MKKDFGAQTWLFPMPVLMIATYNEDGTPNLMNAAWGGISGENEISICVASSHRTTENLLKRKAFTVGAADAAHTAECDYVGIVSGYKVPDKVERAGFHAEKSAFVDAPVMAELPMTLECELVSYDKETERLTGKIVNVSAEERVLDADGKIDVKKLNPITFDPVHHAYLALGETVGTAFSDGAKFR